MKQLENVVGVVGGIAALVGCFIPVAARGALSLGIGEAGGLSMLLYVCAGVGLAVSLAALIGKMLKEEWFQIAAGVAGLIVTFLVQRQLTAAGASTAFGMHMLYWGFGMLVAEGLIHFGDRKVALPAA